MILLADCLAAIILFYLLFPALLPEKIRRLIRRPNVIYIVLDAARADHFSGYGYSENTTPCIDAIARRGTTFLNNFSPGTFTMVSVPRYFSSRYYSKPIWGLSEWDWGIRSETPQSINQNFDNQQIFLPEFLSRHGYITSIFYDHASFTKTSFILSLFQQKYSLRGLFSYPHLVDKEVIAKTISWLEDNRDKNFFIYCHIMSPHEPYPPKKEDYEFLHNRDISILQYVRDKNTNRKSWFSQDWSKKELEYLGILYDSNLKHTDNYVGVLFNKLVELGLEDKTLIIITSDHGENLGEHNVLGHGFRTYDSVTHVPLIMVYPPLIPPGVKISGLTESIDIMPTILDICGIEMPTGKEMDGISLLPVISNPAKCKPAIFTNESIRTEDYRYIAPNELHDLKKDPRETTNIASDNPKLTNKLKTLFQQIMQPYKERYDNARRVEPPDYPFYILIHQFRITPVEGFERCTNRNMDFLKVIKEVSPHQPWLLNNRASGSGLFCIPANGTPRSLTISTRLPDGIYDVSILVETSASIPISKISSNLLFRFNQNGDPSQPAKIESLDNKRKNNYYLNLGMVKIQENRFWLKLTYNPPDRHPIAIRHIRFIPELLSGIKSGKIMTEEELLKRRKSLNALGYL